jgi:predicted ATPase
MNGQDENRAASKVLREEAVALREDIIAKRERLASSRERALAQREIHAVLRERLSLNARPPLTVVTRSRAKVTSWLPRGMSGPMRLIRPRPTENRRPVL